MDDTQQQVPPAPVMPGADSVSSMSDVAGMTPPPAPVMPTNPTPAGPMPEPAQNPMAAASAATTPTGGASAEDDYSYAEDVLNEILDSLDRIEAKLEAMEKKQG